MTSDISEIKLDESWLTHLHQEFTSSYMQDLKCFLLAQKRSGKTVYPPGSQIFTALNTVSLDDVRVVILGQDPYHGPGQAHGLSFSVLPGVRIPPSLLNIYKEIQAEYGVPIPRHGCLQSWAEQGVLLLNATLTVEQGMAASHQGKGWERFTDKIIELVNVHCQDVVFLLWGSYAQKKGRVIDGNKHCVLKSVHPSPLSAHRGFLGNGHFKKANEYLVSKGRAPIDWTVPDLD